MLSAFVSHAHLSILVSLNNFRNMLLFLCMFECTTQEPQALFNCYYRLAANIMWHHSAISWCAFNSGDLGQQRCDSVSMLISSIYNAIRQETLMKEKFDELLVFQDLIRQIFSEQVSLNFVGRSTHTVSLKYEIRY